MAYNGSGVFNLYTPGNPVVTGTTIASTWANNTLTDIATGLSTAITKDGQTTTTAVIPFAAGINVTLVTDSTSTTTGAAKVAGGLGVAKSFYCDILNESTGAAWTAYTPTVTADTGTYGAATITLARYRQLGKTLILQLRVSATVSSGSPTEFRVSYPNSQSGKTNTGYMVSAIIAAGATETGLALPTTSTYISFQRMSGAAFSTGCGCYFCGVVEMA